MTNEYLTQLANRACTIAERNNLFTKGSEDLILITSEVVELTKALQKNNHAKREEYNQFIEAEETLPLDGKTKESHKKYYFEKCIKDTIEDEFADIILRILSFNKHYDFMLFRYNDICKEFKEEPYASKDIIIIVCEILESIVNQHLMKALSLTIALAARENIDIQWHLEEKLKYNETRKWN